MPDLRHFIHTLEAAVARHNLGMPGAYRRWTLPPEGGSAAPAGLDPFAVSAAANILYTLARLPADADQRQVWVGTLQGLQDPHSGLFADDSSDAFHATACCVAALELFEAHPRGPLKGMGEFQRTHQLSAFLERLDWRYNPARDGLRGAGLYTALVLSNQVNLEWEERYFTWLKDECDPRTGLFRKGWVAPLVRDGEATLFPHLAGTFAYLTTMEYARRPLRYPSTLVDTCLELYHGSGLRIGEHISFDELAWVYTLNRAERQCGYRYDNVRAALNDFSSRYTRFLQETDVENDRAFDDLYLLSGVAACLAELQQALPGSVFTQHPLRPVLDRRPGI